VREKKISGKVRKSLRRSSNLTLWWPETEKMRPTKPKKRRGESEDFVRKTSVEGGGGRAVPTRIWGRASEEGDQKKAERCLPNTEPGLQNH